ncbi:hypothetical protein Tco_0403545 [Tanacetum coccineum]
MKKKTCKNKIKNIQKEFVEIEVLKSSTQHSSSYEGTILNISEEDVEHQPDSPLQEIIIIDPDDQPMWKSAKTVAPTPNFAIIQHTVDNNFVINSTHLKMILENKFDGKLQVDSHDHILEFLAICDMFKYGEAQNESTQAILDETVGGIFLYKSPNQAFQFLDDKVLFKLDWSTKSQNEHHQKSVAFADGSDSNDDNYRLMEKLEALTIKMDCQFIRLKEELEDMRNKYYDLKDNHASMNDDTSMCERHYIQSKGTDISKIIRKQSKTGKHGHENQKSTKRSQRFKAVARKVKPTVKSSQTLVNQ